MSASDIQKNFYRLIFLYLNRREIGVVVGRFFGKRISRLEADEAQSRLTRDHRDGLGPVGHQYGNCDDHNDHYADYQNRATSGLLTGLQLID